MSKAAEMSNETKAVLVNPRINVLNASSGAYSTVTFAILFNWPIFKSYSRLSRVLKSELLGIVGAGLFTGRMPFLSPK